MKNYTIELENYPDIWALYRTLDELDIGSKSLLTPRPEMSQKLSYP
jgi:hypothetical protein